MSQTHRTVFLAAALAVMANGANIQSPTSTNDLPNPYHEVQGWAQLPSNIEWGAVIVVDPDAHGNLWVLHRKDPAVLEFDASGKLVTSFATALSYPTARRARPLWSAFAIRRAIRFSRLRSQKAVIARCGVWWKRWDRRS